ncbi:DinB superfamily protein [compost metagenome]
MPNRNDEMQVIIDTYKNYWVGYHFSDSSWDCSLSEGKPTIAEIIGHLLYWDLNLITNAFPAVENNEGIVFPEFDSFNQSAYEYARSVTKDRLLDEFTSTRNELSQLLLNSSEIICKPTTTNGVSHCPDTGTPYSLIYIIQEFIDHDRHHKAQMDLIQGR